MSQSLQEFRCPKCDKLLGKVGGSSFVVEIRCKNCRENQTMVYPHPLAAKSVASGTT
jgi:phage FluMu protein Com